MNLKLLCISIVLVILSVPMAVQEAIPNPVRLPTAKLPMSLFQDAVRAFPIHLEEWRLMVDKDAPNNRLGQCRYNVREIGISDHHIRHGSSDEIHSTMYHELAHVLAGSNANHGPEWKAWKTVLAPN